MSAETWLPVPGYEGRYEVSDAGRVRSLTRRDARGCARPGRVLKGSINSRRGHVSINLFQANSRERWMVHALVALAFLGPRPSGQEVCHGDGNPANNNLSNLRYDTHSANALDSVRHGTHANAARTHCVHGHEFTMENTYVYRGKRHCRPCNAIRQANVKARRLSATSDRGES